MKTIIKITILLAAALLLTACTPVHPAETTTAPTTVSTTAPTTVPATTPPTEPEAPKMNATGIFQELLGAGGCFAAELCTKDGTAYGPLQLYAVPTNLKFLNPDGLTQIEAPELSSYPQWLVFRSGDDSTRLTVYHGAPDILLYEKNGDTTYYQAGEEAFDFFRSTFDNLEKATLGRIAFTSDSTGEALLKAYAETAYPAFLAQLAPESMYRYADYEVLSVTVEEAADGILTGKFSYAAKPERIAPIIHTDDMIIQSGDYKGWYQFEVPVALELRQDSQWHEIAPREYDYAYKTAPQLPAAPDAEAAAYLASLPEKLAALQTSSEAADLAALAETFVNTYRAAALAGSTDFDWTVLLTESALEKAEVKAILNSVNTAVKFTITPLQAQMIQISEDTAYVYHYETQVFFVKKEGKWLIDSVIKPYLGT